MASLNEILTTRFNNALYKLMGIRAPGGGPSSQLAPEILPVHLSSSGDSSENQILKDERRYSFELNTSITGVVGQGSFILLFNPAGSGYVVVLESAHLSNGQTTQLGAFRLVNATAATQAFTITPLDTRIPIGASGAARSAAQIFLGTVAALPGSITLRVFADLLVNSRVSLPFPVVLTPGFGVLVWVENLTGGPVTGSNLDNAGVSWRERPLEQSETNV